MRLRSDGMKRCHRCGSEVMGLAKRAEIGAAILAAEYPAPVGSIATATTVFPRRLAVVWSSEASQ